MRVPIVPPKLTDNPGHNPGPVGRPEAEWKEKLVKDMSRQQLRRALGAGNVSIAAARAEREAELERIRETCGRARQRLKEQCAGRRTRSRSTAKARIAAARGEKREAHKLYKVWGAETKPKKRRRAYEAIQESDSAVEHEILGAAPELLPVWKKVKRSIRGSARRSRAEAFFEWAEENAGDVQAMLADFPSDEAYAEEFERWAAEQAG